MKNPHCVNAPLMAASQIKSKSLLLRSTLVLLGLSIVGCSEPPPPSESVSSRPVKLFIVDKSLSAEIRQFPASIEAATQAELSFRVSGQLEALPIREGEVVEAEQVLAQLDATDFKNTLEDREAVFENTERNFRRAGELIDSGSISQLDYDRMEADFRSARAALAQAKADLNYATLRAPFRGRIARRYVDNFEEVRAKQSIVYLQDTELLDVIIAMPESVIRSVTSGGEGELSSDPLEESSAASVRAMASFDNRPNISYALELKELATRADPDTQTFPVTFSMRQPDEFTVLPGMTAQVEVDFSDLLTSDAVTWVPARAVQADATLSPRVFVLDAQSMQVRSISVETGRVSGDMIEVLSGLVGGEEIVAVGASYLSDGMQVTRMLGGEQAIPRETAPGDSDSL
ncbi:efflux RND transporter periplasmic adaptor subunit [Congregibacter sp.]|jgi:RND family efflux transporter MFP subunit|uniref:efflux RND transporter periplasmic adaptor subunit n=1 Tax=Congregibacter sp. TaxID=2744308 RepID=UPI0039E66472